MDIGRIKSYFHEPGLLTFSLLSLQLVYYSMFVKTGIEGYSLTFSGILTMIFGLITLFFLSSFLELGTSFKYSRMILIPLFIFDLWSHNAYQLTTGAPLDYSLVKDNIGISFSGEALTMISSPFSGADVLILVIFLVITAFFEYLFLKTRRISGYRIKPAVASLAVYMLLLLIPVDAGDGFTLFAKSIFSGSGTPVYAKPLTSDYPYHKNIIPKTSFSSNLPESRRNRPNVFIIMIESFNANFIETKASDGIYYTPNFNSLIKNGMYIERFYGNSVQTCKGQAAVFYSILPSIKGKLFVDYPDLNIGGFPGILAGAGYETLFFQAYHNLSFDNTRDNMHKAGFATVKSYSEYRRREDRKSIWGWGVEDKVFYERFFEVLDSIHTKNPAKPLFAALATVGTHIPCDGMPDEKRTIYKNPQNIREKYSNALRLSDSQLPRFFELLKQRKYLENSIVIITADHSFPMKEHGLYNNEICFYDETFRIPFLVIWDGVIKPERIRERVYSQIDIGPTICDMIGITKADNNMIGRSVFDLKGNRPVFLIQPYNGKFLQVVDYPLKYIVRVKTGREYLFDLKTDPAEKSNLILRDYDKETVSGLKEKLNAVYINQQLIDTNRIRKK